ncbi:putative sh3 domain protein [Botrytis cinerea BcDW1]|uniref:Putative sh3 domain protein n=1 Tax=Botryotinia fuckeliana (strain BcDW1) TaxID=1290391 RepID=M7V385_BOTF1|nr:putative sh3 domain protein [Botrytis cinerea BcDW1]
MTRPEIIRADSIDLQDQNAPSAQDHTKKHANTAPLGTGPPAPHQAEALRDVAAEVADEQHRSPRVSREWANGEGQMIQDYTSDDSAAGGDAAMNGNSQQDDLAIAQNGGLSGSGGEDGDMADAEGDDSMDDDMMDKISSSPSIDDGGYSLPKIWPSRSDSLSRASSSSFSQACGESSSPFVEPPTFFPLQPMSGQLDMDLSQVAHEIQYHHHHLGEYLDRANSTTSNYDTDAPIPVTPEKYGPCVEKHGQDYNEEYFHDQLIAMHDSDQDIAQTSAFDPYDYDEAMTIPYESSEDEEGQHYEDDEDDDDDNDDIPYAADSRFVDSGWGGECLQESEDIDFEFVYALHTFVATVEGQANATKGDTMVLLDDSYLPAEHIETPTERLARLNKHRNIDLTSAMLGDQAEKSKNPLKKAIRRRNAKTVTFTAPTYVEASDVDYSSDEDDGDGGFYGQQEQQAEQQEQTVDDDEIVAIEPLKPRNELREVKSESPERDNSLAKSSLDTTRSSDEILEGKTEGSKSRNGTLRNTDSFFKDDTVETRKITLTPNLLRDDSSTSTRTSNDSEKLKQRPSLDRIEKDLVSDKTKDKKDKKEKKDKEKKPGMLSGLFKRKDKKSKHQDDDLEDSMASSKHSGENRASSPSPSKDSDLASVEESSPEAQKQPGKLQKQPRPETSPSRKQSSREARSIEPQLATISERAIAADSAPGLSLRLVQPEPQTAAPDQQESPSSPTVPSPKSPGPISKMLHSAISSSSEPKPVKAKKAKARVELDDFDSTSEESEAEEPLHSPVEQAQRPIPGSFPDSYAATPATENRDVMEERLSESPVQVSPITPTNSHPPALMVDTSSQEEPPSPMSSSHSPSPELIDADDVKKGPGSSTTSASTPTWSDSHLRTFFDDDTDIRDLLVVVYDKSGVVPAGSDHPVVGNLFKEENAKLADITNRLDGMLGDWLARKMRTQSSR